MPTLEENIENYLLDFQKNVPKETQDVLINAIEKLKESKKLSKALKVGDKIPEFSLSNHDRKIVHIKDIVEKKQIYCPELF
jgi:outer membrane PBP1 activator LpoA protein